MNIRQYIEKDAALERRFQKVQVDEPTIDDSIAILRGLKDSLKDTMELKSMIVLLLGLLIYHKDILPIVFYQIKQSI